MLQKVCMTGLLVLTFGLSILVTSPTVQAASRQNGFRLPAVKVPSFQVNPPRRFRTTIVDMSSILGKKPVLLMYFAAGDSKSETELKALNALARVYKSFEIYGVTRARTKRMMQLSYKRLEKLGISLPVLVDEKGLLKYYTMTRQTPAYTVIDAKGMVKLVGAASLTERVAENTSLMAFLQKIAAKKKTTFIRAMGYSPNCYNMVGKKAPVFKASNALTPGAVSLTATLKKDKRPTILVFWSVTCPHCQAVLPVLNSYYKKNKTRFKVLTLASVTTPSLKQKMRSFAAKHSFSLSVLDDLRGKISNSYYVMMVPTFYLVDSKGMIRATWMGSKKTLASDIESKLALLKK